jgi:hypothetical protein
MDSSLFSATRNTTVWGLKQQTTMSHSSGGREIKDEDLASSDHVSPVFSVKIIYLQNPSPSPNITLGMRVSTCELGGVQTFSLWSAPKLGSFSA